MTTLATSAMIPKRERIALEPSRITARLFLFARAQLGRGAVYAFAVAPALFIALPADAADRRVWHGSAPSSVVIGPPTVDHATATVTLRNTTVHSRSETFPLDWEGIKIDVHFQWQADGNAERVTIVPPDGYMAQPESITVLEGETGQIQIVKFEGM